MPKSLANDPPAKKKPAPNIERAMASAAQRPDALAVRPRGPAPNEYQRKPLPFGVRAPEAHSTWTRLPNTLDWQQGFFDTLSTLAGVPNEIIADPDYGPVTASFHPRGQKISFGGNLGQFMGADPKDIRWSAAHEWGHLLDHNDDAILKAFEDAAPLPRQILPENDYRENAQTLYNQDYRGGPDSSRTSNAARRALIQESFADMFADALAKRLPQMHGEERERSHYPWTKQFRSRSRRNMVDSLVNTLLPRLK